MNDDWSLLATIYQMELNGEKVTASKLVKAFEGKLSTKELLKKLDKEWDLGLIDAQWEKIDGIWRRVFRIANENVRDVAKHIVRYSVIPPVKVKCEERRDKTMTKYRIGIKESYMEYDMAQYNEVCAKLMQLATAGIVLVDVSIIEDVPAPPPKTETTEVAKTESKVEGKCICPECGKVFGTAIGVGEHRFRMHGYHARKRGITCPKCGKHVKNKHGLLIHNYLKHTEKAALAERKIREGVVERGFTDEVKADEVLICSSCLYQWPGRKDFGDRKLGFVVCPNCGREDTAWVKKTYEKMLLDRAEAALAVLNKELKAKKDEKPEATTTPSA